MTRPCRKPGCSRDAEATLTTEYHLKVDVLGMLSTVYDPTALDLCARHAVDFSAPHGWKLVRYRERDGEG